MHQPVVDQIIIAQVNFINNIINHAPGLFQCGIGQPHIGHNFGINANFTADINHIHIPFVAGV